MTSEKRKRICEALVKKLALEDVIEEVLTSIGEETNPEDIFSEEQLIDWAEENGYSK